MNILQQPDTLSFSMNLKKFIVSATGTISFILRLGERELISHKYEPGTDGMVEIDVRDIVHPQLSYIIKDSGEVYRQSNLTADFTAIINTTEIVFRVVRGGVDQLADSAANFLTQNFLTWQPSVKPVTYYSPEFLTYYAVGAGKIKLRAYFTDDEGNVTTEQEHTIVDIIPGIAYTIPLQYSVVAGWLGNKLPAYYDVWAESTAGHRFTYIQRYYAENMRSAQEQWVLFENSLGGLDTFRAYGSDQFNAEHTHNLAETDEVSQEYRVDTERKHQKNTGYLNKEEARWLLDFFPSQKKYLYTGSYLRQIVVMESDVTGKLQEAPLSYTFTYKYTNARPLLNLPRTDVPTDVLNITIPEVGSFTVPPRLAEVPRLPLSEGTLFPVQNPYSENWGTTTVGMIGDFISKTFASYKFFKGYFSIPQFLILKYPNPQEGWYAFVGTPWPGKVYECRSAGTWVDTGFSPTVGDDIFVELLKRYIDGTTIYWDAANRVIKARGGGDNVFSIVVSIETVDIGRVSVTASGDSVGVTPSADGGTYTVTGTAGGTVTVSIVAEEGYQVQQLDVDDVSQGNISEYTFEHLDRDHTMKVWLEASEETPTDFLVRSDLPGSYYSSTQDALDAVKATYPDGLTQNVTISCVKPAKEKRSSGHYIASLSGWNRRSMYMLTIDGKNDLYLNGNALGCLAFSNVDNIVIKDIHFEDFSNYVGYQVPDALGAISFTGKISQYARNMFVGGCTFNGKSMTDDTVMSTNSVILINTENVTINNSSFTDGGGPVVNANTCNLLSILNNDFVLAPVGVGYPTAVTVSGGKILILEDNRMSGDNRYSFVAVTNMEKAYIRRNSFRDGGSMALSVSSSVPMSKLVIESNLFAGMLSNTGSINTWAQSVIGLCPTLDMELNNNTFYMSGNNAQQYCTRWGTINRLKIFNNVVVDAGHAVHFIYGFAFDNVSELVSDYNVFQYKLHDNITYGSLLRVFNMEGVEGSVEINADQGCRFWKIQELGYDIHSVLVSDGVDADALDNNLMITTALDAGNPANNDNVPDIDLAYKLKSASANSRGCYNLHGSVIDETYVVPGYTGSNMEDGSTFSNASRYGCMAEDILMLKAKALSRNLMPVFSVIGSADSYLVLGRYGLLSPLPRLDINGEYVEDELYDINVE